MDKQIDEFYAKNDVYKMLAIMTGLEKPDPAYVAKVRKAAEAQKSSEKKASPSE